MKKTRIEKTAGSKKPAKRKKTAAPARTRSPTKPQRAAPAALPSTVVISFTGTFDEVAATVDGTDIDTPTATLQLAPGKHELDWKVTGNEGDKYKVSITGSRPPWSDDFKIPAGGEDFGSKKFDV